MLAGESLLRTMTMTTTTSNVTENGTGGQGQGGVGVGVGGGSLSSGYGFSTCGSAGKILNNYQNGNGCKDMERCSCCPYGYHIDRDFVPFTKKMLSREANVDRLRELRSKLRSQRKSMDKLLGVGHGRGSTSLSSSNSNKGNGNTWEVETLSRATVDVWKSEVRRSEDRDRNHHHHPQHQHQRQSKTLSSDRNYQGGDEFVDCCEDENETDQILRHDIEDAVRLESSLQAAVKDFEDALNRTRPLHRVLTYDIPDSQKFHTFPRIKAPPPNKDKDKDHHLPPFFLNGDLATMRDKESSRPSIRDLTNKMEGSLLSDYVPSSRHRQPQQPPQTPPLKKNLEHNNDENESLADILQFKNERVEVVASRMRELEEQVKMIPELQVKVTLLAEEKRQVMKLLDNEKQKRAKLEEIYESLKNSKANEQIGDVNQNVVPVEKQKKKTTRDTGVGHGLMTRDVGSSPVSPTTRSIAVGENIPSSEKLQPVSRSDSSSPTGSLVGTLRRRVRTFETGVQVTDLDLGIKSSEPVLQIVEKVDFGIQVGEQGMSRNTKENLFTASTSSTTVATPKMKTVGTHAKPRTAEIGTGFKPKSRETGINTTELKVEKPKVKHVGVSTCSTVRDSSTLTMNTDNVVTTTSRDEKEIPKISPPSTASVGSNTVLTLKPHQSDNVIVRNESHLKSQSSFVSEESQTMPTASSRSQSSSPTASIPIGIGSTSFTILSHQEKKSIARSPPDVSYIQATGGSGRSTSASAASSADILSSSPPEQKPPSRIPRLATPSTSPILPTKPHIKSAEPLPDSLNYSSRLVSQKSIAPKSPVKPHPLQRQATYTKEFHGDKKNGSDSLSQVSDSSEEDDLHEQQERERRTQSPEQNPNHPSSEMTKPRTSAGVPYEFSTIDEVREREKINPSKEMLGALKVLNDALLRGRTTQQVTTAISIILHEWFRVAGTKSADPGDVEDYLDCFENFSPQLLRYIVNMPDGNGNTSMHYAVSHGNFDVVSILLDSKVCDPNKANKAGYTSVMLVSLAKVLSDTHRQVVRRLFSMGDVNIKAAQHGQTALMLAASHGRLDTVRLLLEAGADINIQDEDGSTALMCASEHGHGEIVKYLLTQPDCDPHLTDNDGSTALSVCMEAGHKDIGVMLYAHMHFVVPNPHGSSTSPNSMRAKKSRSETPRSSPSHSSPTFSSQTSPVIAKKQYSTH